jgi:hypothetical protein
MPGGCGSGRRPHRSPADEEAESVRQRRSEQPQARRALSRAEGDIPSAERLPRHWGRTCWRVAASSLAGPTMRRRGATTRRCPCRSFASVCSHGARGRRDPVPLSLWATWDLGVTTLIGTSPATSCASRSSAGRMHEFVEAWDGSKAKPRVQRYVEVAREEHDVQMVILESLNNKHGFAHPP